MALCVLLPFNGPTRPRATSSLKQERKLTTRLSLPEPLHCQLAGSQAFCNKEMSTTGVKSACPWRLHAFISDQGADKEEDVEKLGSGAQTPMALLNKGPRWSKAEPEQLTLLSRLPSCGRRSTE